MRTVELTQGQFAIVDDVDYELVSQFKWYAKWEKDTQTFYAARNGRTEDGRRTTQRMHTFLMGGPVDHKNHDTLDNRRDNLRIANRSQNGANRGKLHNNKSGYKGVWWNKRNGKWQVKITCQGVRKHLGYFTDPVEAAKAYDKAARELFGEYAKTNF